MVKVDDKIVGLASFEEDVDGAYKLVERQYRGTVFKVNGDHFSAYVGPDHQKTERVVVYNQADEGSRWIKLETKMENPPQREIHPADWTDEQIELAAEQTKQRHKLAMEQQREMARLLRQRAKTPLAAVE